MTERFFPFQRFSAIFRLPKRTGGGRKPERKNHDGRKRNLHKGIGFLSAFVLWTVLIQLIDVQAAGPKGTRIGFAAFNVWFHQLTGVHMTVYAITDWLGLVPIFICLCFGGLGFLQLIRRRSLKRVDKDILLLGAYYLLVISAYLLFEMIPINYRPILIEGRLEASYPSSTTLLVLSVMPTLVFQTKGGVPIRGFGRLRPGLPSGFQRLW